MLFRSGARVCRCGVVVSRVRKVAAGVSESGVALQALRRSDSAIGTRRQIHLLLRALLEIEGRMERGRGAWGRASCKIASRLCERIGSELTGTEKT